jgi:hypothetical protein
MEESPRIEEAFSKVRRSVDTICAHLSEYEIEILQEKILFGIMVNKKRKEAASQRPRKQVLGKNKTSS